MNSNLNQKLKELGDGDTIKIKSKEFIFKLSHYKKNPIVRPQDIGLTWCENKKKKIGAVFNPGAEIYRDKIILLPRCHKCYKRSMYFDQKLGIKRYCLENYISEIWPLVSSDGVNFKRLRNVVIRGDGTDHPDFAYGIEDTRIVNFGHRYLLIGCGKIKPPFRGGNSDRIAVYSTKDFIKIEYHGMVKYFDSRNVIPFFVDKKTYLLLRFHPNIHLTKLSAGVEQLLDPQKYRRRWRRLFKERNKSLLFRAREFLHEKEKIGPSTQLIKTKKGLLFLYHAVGEIDIKIAREYGLRRKIERGYSICAALLDIKNPKRVIARTQHPIYIPSMPYESKGNNTFAIDVPNVVFPVGTILIDNKLLIYCGAGDKYITLLSCNLDNLVDFLFKYCTKNRSVDLNL
jgi:predicted GH43/DUF377 family glycosyl hydrolase